MTNGRVSREQYDKLIEPLHPTRIAERKQFGTSGQTFSYLASWDVRRYLTRIFGFGGWDGEVVNAVLQFDELGEVKDNGKQNRNVCYLVTYRLTIRDPYGQTIATYAECATGTNSQPDRAQAHDTAIKAGVSDALKRCAINLGDQFGLSLYSNYKEEAPPPVIGRTLNMPEAPKQGEEKAGLPQPTQVAPDYVPNSTQITDELTAAKNELAAQGLVDAADLSQFDASQFDGDEKP